MMIATSTVRNTVTGSKERFSLDAGAVVAGSDTRCHRSLSPRGEVAVGALAAAAPAEAAPTVIAGDVSYRLNNPLPAVVPDVVYAADRASAAVGPASFATDAEIDDALLGVDAAAIPVAATAAAAAADSLSFHLVAVGADHASWSAASQSTASGTGQACPSAVEVPDSDVAAVAATAAPGSVDASSAVRASPSSPDPGVSETASAGVWSVAACSVPATSVASGHSSSVRHSCACA